ncbi:MAG: class III signal peptide-containing protein [Candidatus Bilamarchaeaceae archaeon]
MAVFFAKKNKRGQITLEYLILSVIVLAMLAISIITLTEINTSSKKTMDNIIFRKSALDLHAAVEEVCALGGGNLQTIIIKNNMTVQKEGENLIFEDADKKMKLEIICPYSLDVDNPLTAGRVIIENEKQIYGNTIKIRNS